MVAVSEQLPQPLPDDPNKWDGWTKYKSPNFYERLCLDPKQNPTNELIEAHCRELLRWWQKKLPLKNQPSNPLTQLLRPGLDESSRYLTQARVELLDPQRRRAMDNELAAQEHEHAITEFHKFLTFALAEGTLTLEGEKNLIRFGHEHRLTDEEMQGYIETELNHSGAKRAVVEPIVPPPTAASANGKHPRRRTLPPKEEFMRMLRLSALDSDGMSDETRDAFVNMAENLGLEASDAEDLIDDYLDEADGLANAPLTSTPAPRLSQPAAPAPATAAAVSTNENNHPEEEARVYDPVAERARYTAFVNSLGGAMLFIPSGEFHMGSEAPEAAPNERPLTKVALDRFYLCKHPVTNAQYELFDPSHKRKRAAGAGDLHPVVYVSSLDAIKFCQWLTSRERKKYRLPTEAEWEYAARGIDSRKYPWGNYEGRGDLGNFADKNTVFAWSDREIDDGFAESSPVGSFPLGASPFGIEDMAGNVWEWCADFFEAYRGTNKSNPRGGAPGGQKRVYRGGSWKSRFHSMRATTRGSNLPNYSCNDLGFRIVCECE